MRRRAYASHVPATDRHRSREARPLAPQAAAVLSHLVVHTGARRARMCEARRLRSARVLACQYVHDDVMCAM